MASLQLDKLTKVFDGSSGLIVAVEELDLDIKDGEFIVVVGPSGCGKSTTLRMVAGLETVSDGEIRINDEVINDKAPKNRDIAMVFQSYALYPHKTVHENMAYGLRLSTDLADEEIDKRVEEAATMMGIEDLLQKKPGSLSGGQQQRVATGRAIVREPEVFLFDEPLSNLDAKLRQHMRTELARLHSELGITTMYVTHDQEEAMTMADRIVVLNDGKLQQIGAPKQVYYEPTNAFVADFIGSPSMNFFDAELQENGDGSGVLVHDSFTYAVSPDVVRNIDTNGGSTEVILGVRPENIEPATTAPEEKTITGKVDVVEVVGSDNFIYLDLGGKEVRVRTDSDIEPDVGSTFTFTLDEDDIHLFDAHSEVALTHGTKEAKAIPESALETSS
ncbi:MULTISPECIES: ABC transporter ATP-binding protein [unclassified Haladaptatus]|uniref:ABC transporter ATP-binding protein n=1 Tax=unclassified Haladaptatus TaxID=2622732 RepID=UPI0023E76610|nr:MULTISPECIES: sn-glycerol-3-phosphate ABC transporter ATP-binding protein UgpC [unclassified Haladaptatus]